ncbi:hypothetical protein ACHAPV_002153 [Trichoderma viride]
MSHPSTVSEIASLSKEDIKMNPLFTGLLTPPESPIRYAQSSLDDNTTQSPVPSISNADSSTTSEKNAPNALEALFSAIQDTKADTIQQNKIVLADMAPTSATPIDFSYASEIIYSIIEQGVEEKMIEAVDQIRLNASRLDQNASRMEKSLASVHREHVDIRDQNDTMSRQLDLHYRTIEQNIEEFKTQSKTMNTMIGAQADNLAATITMVSHLSQVVTNLPMALNQVVYTAVQQQAQQAMHDIMFAQQQAMFSVSDVSGTRRSVSSDGSFSHCTCHHRGLEFESMSSMQHSNGSSNSTASSTKRGFRYSLKKLFRSSK